MQITTVELLKKIVVLCLTQCVMGMESQPPAQGCPAFSQECFNIHQQRYTQKKYPPTNKISPKNYPPTKKIHQKNIHQKISPRKIPTKKSTNKKYLNNGSDACLGLASLKSWQWWMLDGARCYPAIRPRQAGQQLHPRSNYIFTLSIHYLHSEVSN